VSVSSFLAELRSRDIRLWVAGERLRCSAPAGVLTPELRDQLHQHKSEILEFLRRAEAIAEQPNAIIPLQPNGRRTPVFAVPGHNGDVFAYREFARHVGNDQPLFGLHPPGLDGHIEPLARAEDLAAYFAEQIRAFQPSGPHIIAGYCAGGAVALELARQLVQRGATVSFLALFGCPYPTVYRFLNGLPYWGRRIAMHLKAAAALSSFRERRDYLIERLSSRRRWARIERSPAGTDPLSLIKFRFEQAHGAMVRRYTPKPFPGRVCLLLPNKEWAVRSDCAPLRWRSVARYAEEYYGPDSCDPDRMLLEPDVLAFAEIFGRCRDGSARQIAP